MIFKFTFHQSDGAVEPFSTNIEAEDIKEAESIAGRLCKSWGGTFSDLVERKDDIDVYKVALEQIPTCSIVDELLIRLKNSNAIEFISFEQRTELRSLLVGYFE